MKTILLIRHGATAGNLKRRYIGRTDEPLCETGIAQISALRQRDLEVDQVFVSPMLRTRQTAEILFPRHSCVVVEDLRETDFGIFEGKTAAELSDEPAYQAWVDSWCLGEIPNGESKETMAKRCCTAFRRAMERVKASECAALVIHGGVIMALLEHFGAEKADFYNYHVKNGGYLRCLWDGKTLSVVEKG